MKITLGYTSCFPIVWIASDALHDVSHFPYFPMYRLYCCGFPFPCFCHSFKNFSALRFSVVISSISFCFIMNTKSRQKLNCKVFQWLLNSTWTLISQLVCYVVATSASLVTNTLSILTFWVPAHIYTFLPKIYVIWLWVPTQWTIFDSSFFGN